MKITPTVTGRLGIGTQTGGDLGGGITSPTVTGIRGVPVCATLPTTGEVLTFDGSEWCPAPSASTIEVFDEGISLTAALASMDFAGAGVTATVVGDAVTVTIPGSGGAGGTFFNVMADFGAVNDNTTDDTAAIQAAIDAAIANGGGTVYFPGGLGYKITATLNINPGTPLVITLLGDGAFYSASSTVRMATANTTAFAVNANADHTIFERLKIQGPGGGSSGDGIDAQKAVNLVYTTIWQFYNGLHLRLGSYYARTYGCMFYANVSRGILCDQGGNNTAVIATHVHSSAIGIDFAGGLSDKVIGGSVEACTTAAIRANGGTNAAGLTISGVYFEQVDGVTDILLGDVSIVRGTTLSGNTHVKSAYSGTGWAVHAVRADGLTINGGEIDSSDAIWVETYPAVITPPELRNAGTQTLVAGTIVLDPAITTSASPVGTAAHGSSPYLAPIDHGHALGGTVGGELTGTLPNPTVVATHSGSAHTDFIAKAFLDAKGDLISATADNTPSRLPVGADGLALLADSSQTSGLRWGSIASTDPVHVHVDNVTFSGDGATTVFVLPAAPVDAYSIGVYVGTGRNNDWTLSGAMLDTLTFGAAPTSGTNNISVDIAAAVA